MHDRSRLASPEPKPRHSMHVHLTPGFHTLGHNHSFRSVRSLSSVYGESEDFVASVEDYDFAVVFSGLVEGLLKQGKIKTHPVKLGVGLEHVLEGLNDMRRGAVTGQKLVYRL